jgi:membrane fusion protein (multidrug efflux system)
VSLDDGTPVDQSASLQFSEVTVSEETGTVTVRALIDNPSELLLPGLFVRAEVPVEHRERAILVPQQAVSRDPKGGATVMLVNADSKVEQRAIAVSRTIGSNWLVESGLAEGERVIVAGLQKIAPGAPVTVAATAANATQGQ